MSDQVIHLINQNAAELEVPDLGLVMEASEDLLVSDQFDYGELCGSEDLKLLVTAGTIVVNDGTENLIIADAIKVLRRQSVRDLEKNYYSKAQVAASGQAVIHWDNIVNAPSFGSPNQKAPVRFIAIGLLASAPAIAPIGTVYVNTTDDKYYKSDGTTWQDVGSVLVDHRVVDTSKPDDGIYVFDGSSWTQTDIPLTDNDGVVCDDQGDGKQAQFVYNEDGTNSAWVNIGSISFGPHLDGGPDKHKTTEIATIVALSNIGTSIGDSVHDVFVALNTLIGSINASITNIDGRVTQNTSDIGAIDGRVTQNETNISNLQTDMTNVEGSITTIQGDLTDLETIVTNNYNDMTTTDIDLQAQIDAIQSGVLDGFKIENSTYYALDSVRGKWLGPREPFDFGKKGSAKNMYLRTVAGVPSNLTGTRIPKDMVLVGATAQISSTGSLDIHIRKNKQSTDEALIQIVGSTGVTNDTLNVAFDADDVIMIKCTCPSGNAKNANVVLFFAEDGGDE